MELKADLKGYARSYPCPDERRIRKGSRQPANRISSDFTNRVLKLVGALKRRLCFLPTFSDITVFRQERIGPAASEKKIDLLVTGLITPKHIGIYRQSTICNFNQWGMP